MRASVCPACSAASAGGQRRGAATDVSPRSISSPTLLSSAREVDAVRREGRGELVEVVVALDVGLVVAEEHAGCLSQDECRCDTRHQLQDKVSEEGANEGCKC